MTTSQSGSGSGADRTVVALVDADGTPLGECEKLAAHEAPGRLHLAFSVFLFNAVGDALFQQRARTKYHFASWWANACCSHPAPGERLLDSAVARVREELGISVQLELAGSFTYRAADPTSTLVEHELDHVFVGALPDPLLLVPDAAEVADWRVVSAAELAAGRFPMPLAPWVTEAYALAEGHRARRAAGGSGSQGRPAP